MVHRVTGAGGFHGVGRDVIALDDKDRSGCFVRLSARRVVGQNRDVQLVAWLCVPRDLGADLARVLIDRDGPTVLGERGCAVFEGVTVWCLVAFLTAQTLLGQGWLQAGFLARLLGFRAVGRDLDVVDNLELHLDLVGGVVRVGGLDLRGDHGSQRDGVVSFRSDLAVLVHGHGPARRHRGIIDLVLGRRHSLVALHDGLGLDLRIDVLVRLTLCNSRLDQVRYLRVVRVNNYQQRKLVFGTVGVGDHNPRLRERAWGWVLRCCDGDVIGFWVQGCVPALINILVIELDVGFETAVFFFLHQVLDQVRYLGEGH